MSTSIKFVHIREYPGFGFFAGYNAPLSIAKAKGGATLAYKVNDDGTVSAGVAKCSKDDHYVKSIGRDLATSRLGQFTFPKGFNTRMFESNFSVVLVMAV